MLRQQSYKLAQQTPVNLPPLPHPSPASTPSNPTPTPLLLSLGTGGGGGSTNSSFSAGSSMESSFRPCMDLNAELHAHQEEEEEEEDDEENLVGSGRPWPTHQHLHHPHGSLHPGASQELWTTLPTTMAECRLTDSNSSLRLSPLLHLHGGSASPQPPSSPFRWVGDSHLPTPPPSQGQGQQGPGHERMDTSGP